MNTVTAITIAALVAGAIGIVGGIFMIWRARVSPSGNIDEIVENAPYHLLR